MEVNSIVSGAYIAEKSTELANEQSKVSSFQNIFEQAQSTNDKKKLMNACVEFEGYFIQMMYKEMRKTVNSGNNIFQKSYAQKIFEEMLDEEVSKQSARSGGVGLAGFMYKQLSRDLE